MDPLTVFPVRAHHGRPALKSFGYVYLIGSPTFRWYKIGKSRSVNIRLERIGVLLPFRVELFALWRAWSSGVESQLHRDYKASRIHGEWFSFSQKELLQVITTEVANASLVYPGEINSRAIAFQNLERDFSPKEGKHPAIKFVKEIDHRIAVQHILARKLKQAFRDYPADS